MVSGRWRRRVGDQSEALPPCCGSANRYRAAAQAVDRRAPLMTKPDINIAGVLIQSGHNQCFRLVGGLGKRQSQSRPC